MKNQLNEIELENKASLLHKLAVKENAQIMGNIGDLHVKTDEELNEYVKVLNDNSL